MAYGGSSADPCTYNQASPLPEIGEMFKESITYAQILWKTPRVSSLPLVFDHGVQSPPFSFAGGIWILKMYPLGKNYPSECLNGCNTKDLVLERLRFRTEHQTIFYYKVYFLSWDGKKHNTTKSFFPPNLSEDEDIAFDMHLRNKLKNSDILNLNDRIVIVCELQGPKIAESTSYYGEGSYKESFGVRKGNDVLITVGKLFIKSYEKKSFSWSLPNIQNFPPTVDYGVQSPKFSCKGAIWILKMYPYGQTKFGSKSLVDVVIERLCSKIPKHTLRYQISVGNSEFLKWPYGILTKGVFSTVTTFNPSHTQEIINFRPYGNNSVTSPQEINCEFQFLFETVGNEQNLLTKATELSPGSLQKVSKEEPVAQLEVFSSKGLFKVMNDDLAELQLSEIRKDDKRFSESGISETPVVFGTSVAPIGSSVELLDNTNSKKENEEEYGLTAAENSLLTKVLRTQLLETNAVVEIRRKNDNSPLHSVKSFEQLRIPRNLLRGIYSMGFNAPSKIQEISLPTLMANPPVNMIAQAQSGTGKTAAFLLASLSRVNPQEKYPQVLILTPTYELALQIGKVGKQMAKFCVDITFRYAARGTRIKRGETVNEHIVIGTPGKIFDWVRKYHYFDSKKIRVFVLDEADVMISTQGHHDQCIRVHSMLSSDCQMLLFSATYSKEIMNFAEQIITNPIIIRLRKEEETLDNVQQYYIPCPAPEDKYKALKNIYGAVSIGQTIIFCRTKHTASWLGNKLIEDGHSVGYLSGDLNVEEREAVITSFREGKEKILITTNVCARGIDIEQVTLVINFDLPVFLNGHADCETYLHRIGRTGRFGKTGIAVNLISGERDVQVLKTIEEHFKKPILHINANHTDDLEKLC